MSRIPLIEEIEKSYLKTGIPSFQVGDTICVRTRVVEGEKERIQSFEGTVMAKKGSGLSETFTLYRTAYGSTMERVFSLHSPRISSIEILSSGIVRRAKLYYLRNRTGKAAKIKKRFVGKAKKVKPVVAVEPTDS